MKDEIAVLTQIQELTGSELTLFQQATRMLLSKTFIVRGLDKELYDFVIRNIALFDSWFYCMEGELQRDENLGVIAFRGSGDMRARLDREATLGLLVLRQLYEEKRIELTLAAFPSCTVEEFKIKFRAMCNEEPGKSALQKMLQRLSTLKLIGIDGDVTDSDTQLVLYPGIPLALDRNSIEESVAMLVKTEDSDVDA